MTNKQSWSQFGEDTYVFNTFFKTREEPGVYVEAGAMNGIELSNTKLFEEMGWNGVLVEAMPSKFSELTQNRPRDRCFQCVLSDTPGDVKHLSVHDTLPQVSSIVEENKSHQEHWHTSGNSKTVEVKTRTLGDIFKECNLTHVNFFSLDIEGYELFALQGMDWNVRVDVWCIEMLGDRCDAVRNLLKRNGYVYHSTLHINEIWVDNSRTQRRDLCMKLTLACTLFIIIVLLVKLSDQKNKTK